ncbi:MAG TPA: 2-dehydro-3-deoxygalactonokinase [Terriglobia bacterium]|nr:2-dehydro-3-deoxygalactonokinase [Terriglobia bacterium]
MTPSEPLYCIDMGTTNCRVYVTEGRHVWTRVEAPFGVRDADQAKSSNHLREKLEALIAEALDKARDSGLTSVPAFAVGAGMLTSRQGLLEIPHLPAPVGETELARHMRMVSPRLAGGVELLLAPGVRTGSLSGGLESALRSDVMRGEETLVAGLAASGRIKANGAVLNLGSHWKWIWLDEHKCISRSRTALTGELIHVTQSHTLLASGLPKHRPAVLHEQWLELGGREARESGLSRALFCVRLLEQAGQGTPEERLSFLYGAFMEAEMQALDHDQSLRGVESICITGPAALAKAWREKLVVVTSKIEVIEEADRDQAYLEGLRRLFVLAKQQGLV